MFFLHQTEEFAAYILIKVHSGKDLEVFQAIKALQHKYPLRELSNLYGDYDLLVKVQMDNPNALEDFVFSGLRQIQGIAETQTLISARSIEFK